MLERHHRTLRLPYDLAARLDKEAELRHVSVNVYVQKCVEDALKSDESRRKEDGTGERRGRKPERDERPRGLGLRLAPVPVAEPAPQRLPELPANMTINVGSQGVTGGDADTIATLADYVAKGPLLGRGQRQREMVAVLRCKGTTEDERVRLTKQLETAIAERMAQRPALTSIGRLFGS